MSANSSERPGAALDTTERGARAAATPKVTRLPARYRQRDGEPPKPTAETADGKATRTAKTVRAAAERIARRDKPPAPSLPPPASPVGLKPSILKFIGWIALLMLVPVLLAAAAAYVAANHLEEVRAGRSEIMFHLPELSDDAADRFLATQTVIIRSQPVVQPVAEAESLAIDDLRDELDAEIVQGSTLLRLEYQDSNPERIERVLEALTLEYLSLLRDIAVIEGASHRLLGAPYLLEEPVSPKPMRNAAIGAVVGLAIAFAGLIILAQTRRTS